MEQGLTLPKVRLKLEEGAKGEVKISVAIDGDDEEELIPRLIYTFRKIKLELETKEVK